MNQLVYHKRTGPAQATVVGKVNAENGTIDLYGSRCSNNDAFSRKAGRETAKSRKLFTVAIVGDPNDFHTTRKEFMNVAMLVAEGLSTGVTIMDNNKKKNRTKKAKVA